MHTCPEEVIVYMHAYLDGDISYEDEQKLKDYLNRCADCKEIMNGLTEAIAFLGGASRVEAPAGFVEGVMGRLPKEKKQSRLQRWFRHHPMLSAAALFFILMSASLFSSYENQQQFSVTKQPNLIVEGETVIVPEGEVVQGDIVVKNGTLRIEGEVEGNVTVIRGTKYMASTAVVTGNSQEINEVFEWIWYKMKQFAKDIVPSKETPKE